MVVGLSLPTVTPAATTRGQSDQLAGMPRADALSERASHPPPGPQPYPPRS